MSELSFVVTDARAEPYAAAPTRIFGWCDTLEPVLSTRVSTIIPGFSGETRAELAVPCTYDLEVAAARYLHGLDDGELPALFLFSGTPGAGWLRRHRETLDALGRVEARRALATWDDVIAALLRDAGEPPGETS